MRLRSYETAHKNVCVVLVRLRPPSPTPIYIVSLLCAHTRITSTAQLIAILIYRMVTEEMRACVLLWKWRGCNSLKQRRIAINRMKGRCVQAELCLFVVDASMCVLFGLSFL